VGTAANTPIRRIGNQLVTQLIATGETMSTRPTAAEGAERLKAGGILAIVRGAFTTPHLIDIASTLAAMGYTAMEVTLNSPSALDHIAAMSKQLGSKMMIGAGTVKTAANVDQALAAGAQFLISPGFDTAAVQRAQAENVLHLPGVFTPTEALAAAAQGCRMLKLFPADTVGPNYLKALMAPLDDMEFVPTGGVAAENIRQWRRAGAVAVAAGSTLITRADQTMLDLKDRAQAMRRAWNEAANA
jgi:2-dehydro-3-deoxyphosphogluconate aldolase/(4S)-4-hydroxy-2-oxoglutarate aldolase